MVKRRQQTAPPSDDKATPRWRSRSSIFVLSLVVTNLVTNTGTWFGASRIDKERIAEARADVVRAEERAAFIETWSAAELYALATTATLQPIRMSEFASKFPDSNPVGGQFRNILRNLVPTVNERQKKAEYELAKNRIQLSNERYTVITSFLALVKDGPHYDPAIPVEKADATWLDRLETIRIQARNLEKAI